MNRKLFDVAGNHYYQKINKTSLAAVNRLRPSHQFRHFKRVRQIMVGTPKDSKIIHVPTSTDPEPSALNAYIVGPEFLPDEVTTKEQHQHNKDKRRFVFGLTLLLLFLGTLGVLTLGIIRSPDEGKIGTPVNIGEMSDVSDTDQVSAAADTDESAKNGSGPAGSSTQPQVTSASIWHGSAAASSQPTEQTRTAGAGSVQTPASPAPVPAPQVPTTENPTSETAPLLIITSPKLLDILPLPKVEVPGI